MNGTSLALESATSMARHINNSTISSISSSNSSLIVGREVSLHFSIAFGSLIGAVTSIGVLANALVVLAVLGDKKMRKSPMNLLLLNLAIADLLYLLAFCPFWLSMTVYGDGGWHFTDQLCPVARFLGNVFLVISILTYLAICVERYVAIVHPMQASVWCTRSRIAVIALGIWAFAMAYQFPYLALFKTFTLPNNLRVCRNPLAKKSTAWLVYKWSEFALTYAIPILLSMLLYSRICRVLWENNGFLHKNKTKSSKPAPGMQHRPSGGMIKRVLETRLKETIAEVQQLQGDGKSAPVFSNSTKSTSSGVSAHLKARRSVVKMLMLCVALFFLCYSPMVAYFLWGAIFGRPLPLPFEFVLLTSALVQFQSAFNPFLYTLFATQFREKLARLFWACRRKGRLIGDGGHHKASGKSAISTASTAY